MTGIADALSSGRAKATRRVRRARALARHMGARLGSWSAALYECLLAAMPVWAPQEPEQGSLRGPQALGHALRGLRRPLAAAAVFSIVMNLLALTTPIYMSQVFDRVLTSFSAETLTLLTVMALGLLLLFVALDRVRAQLLTIAALKAEQDLGGPLLAASVRDQLAGRPDASLPLRDLVALRSFATSPAPIALFDAPMTVLFVAVMFLIHWSLGAMLLAGALIMILLAGANQRVTHKRVMQAGRAANSLLSAADLQTRNAEVIEAMGLMPDLEAQWRKGQDRVLGAQLDAHKRGEIFEMATRYLRLALQILALCLGAALVLAGRITPGMMFAASIIFARALLPIEMAVSSWRSLLGAKANYDRIRDALLRMGSPAEPMALPAPAGALALEQAAVLMGTERKPVLRGVSFSLAPGETLGIIGPAASGKSTLARVILGILPPSAGKVRLDGNDIARWPRAAIGRHIGYLPQDVELFPASVALNIARMGQPDSEAVIEAARLAGIHDMVQRLPDGYDTRIMAGGFILSPGQRQRLALARALYGSPKLLVLDEPNANLDGEGEEALEKALQAVKARGITLIVIAHRLGVLRNIERVLLLRDGVVQLLGPRDEVLSRLAQRPAQAQTGTVQPILSIVPAPGASA